MATTLAQPEAVSLPVATLRPRRRSRTRISRTGIAAMTTLALLVLAVLLGPVLWPQDAITQNIAERLKDPSFAHPFGTDRYGRDIFARLLMGGRWSLAGAAAVCLGTSILGFLIGTFAAMSNRMVDSVVGRFVESLLALPGIIMALALTSILGPSFPNLLFALIVTGWPGYARIYRSLILKERESAYVEGARAMGAGNLRVVFRHVLRNVVGPSMVLATGKFGSSILALASLSFLGLGMQPPTPEWGVMINDASSYFQTHPWQMIAPGLCIALTVLAVNLTGDALRDSFDPRTGVKS